MRSRVRFVWTVIGSLVLLLGLWPLVYTLTRPKPADLQVALVAKDAADPMAKEYDYKGHPIRVGEVHTFQVASVKLASDGLGTPAPAVEIAKSDEDQFRKLTRENIGRDMAVIVDGKVVTAPKINSEIAGSMLITLGPDATQADVKYLIGRLMVH